MMTNSGRREGRGVRGEGPVRLRAGGGVGRSPSYDDGCADYTVWISLTSIMRLRMMSYLCVRGAQRAPALAAALGLSRVSVWAALWGMNATWLVTPREAAIVSARSRSKAGGCYAMEWEATETGRKWLWRYGWVTRRIASMEGFMWTDSGFEGRNDVMPWDVARDHAEPSLLRPVAMATARHLVSWGPLQVPRIAEDLGFRRSVVEQYIRRWDAMGWLTRSSGDMCPRSYWTPNYQEAAPQWSFNEYGEAALDRHAAALRWVSQTCGYVPPADDVFLRDEDMVNHVRSYYYSTLTGDVR